MEILWNFQEAFLFQLLEIFVTRRLRKIQKAQFLIWLLLALLLKFLRGLSQVFSTILTKIAYFWTFKTNFTRQKAPVSPLPETKTVFVGTFLNLTTRKRGVTQQSL